MTRLFLYGTLKSGQSNHHRLNGQTFIGNAITTTSYQLFEVACREEPFGPYPALIHLPHPQINTPGLSVMGELWDVTDDCLDMLNQYEDLDRKKSFDEDDNIYSLETTDLRDLSEFYHSDGVVWPALVRAGVMKLVSSWEQWDTIAIGAILFVEWKRLPEKEKEPEPVVEKAECSKAAKKRKRTSKKPEASKKPPPPKSVHTTGMYACKKA